YKTCHHEAVTSFVLAHKSSWAPGDWGSLHQPHAAVMELPQISPGQPQFGVKV
ncbi:hypothetical protein MCOR31_005425, partial [Pyricularia oryzae]